MPVRRSRWELRSLYARLALVLLAVVGLLGAAGGALALWATGRYQDEAEQSLHRELAAALLSDTGIFEEGLSEERLEHIFHTLMVVNPRIEVYLLDGRGGVVTYSAPEGRVVRRRVDRKPIRAFLAGAPLPLYGDDPRSPTGRKIFSAAALPAATDAAAPAYLYIVLGGERYDSVFDRLRASAILRLAGWLAALAVGAAVVAGLFTFRRLTRRLERLDGRMASFRQRQSEPSPATPADGDEIDRLDATFHAMAERIDRQVEELARHDELRRELVANVSHDLRTPIAALEAYLETLLIKDETLAPHERRQYLEIAARHGEHLGKLVAQLFELARLDVEEPALLLETMSLAELTQDVVQKLALAARERDVVLEARLPGRLPPVRADIRLLERAFANLIENALAHTPPGGRVTVGLEGDGDGVEVRCEDTGEGIPPEELPRVFERLFRGRGPHGGNGGAGLGLAIARRIVELHGSRLVVESELGRGTVFSFRLHASGAAASRVSVGTGATPPAAAAGS